MSNNPYQLDLPVYGGEFIGHTAFLRRVMQFVHTSKMNILTISGWSKSGKSSILHEIANRLSDEEYVPVYWGVKEFRGFSGDRILYHLARTIARKAAPGSTDYSLLSSLNSHTQFLSRIRAYVGPRRLVLLLDDIDYVAQIIPGAESLAFLELLRQLTDGAHSISFILSISRAFDDLPLPLQQITRQARYEPISFLTLPELRKLISSPLQNTSIRYTPDAIEFIARLGAGSAYHTRLICKEIFDYVLGTHNFEITVDIVNTVVFRLTQNQNDEFEHLIAGFSPSKLNVLSACALIYKETEHIFLDSVKDLLTAKGVAIADQMLDRTINEFRRCGILLNDYGQGGAYFFANPLMLKWITEFYPLKSIKNQGQQARYRNLWPWEW